MRSSRATARPEEQTVRREPRLQAGRHGTREKRASASGDAAAGGRRSHHGRLLRLESKPRSHDPSRIARAKLPGRERSFRSSARTAVATSSSEKTAGRSRLTRSDRFARARRPGWLRPHTASPSPTWANRSNRLPSLPLVARPPTGANSCKSTMTDSPVDGTSASTARLTSGS